MIAMTNVPIHQKNGTSILQASQLNPQNIQSYLT